MKLIPLLQAGGVTVALLLLCSLVLWTIVLERIFYYWTRSIAKRQDWMPDVAAELKKGGTDKALALIQNIKAPFVSVIQAGLAQYNQDEKSISNAMQRQIAIETTELEKWLGIVGTIGSVTVYVGLFGTVLGIIKAFRDISLSGSGGLSVVIGGISEALICTAAGLAVAVPAVIAYNFFIKKVDAFVVDMELCASEILDLTRNGGRR